MSVLRKKELVTIITPIPDFIPRQLAIDILHSHSEVITLNPLVLNHKPIKAPRDAASDEYYSTWYEIVERIQYIPGFGKMGSGKISFKGCFHDMPWGLQAHIYAPMSTDLRYKYRIAGNQPGVEPPEPMEMGLAALGAPSNGLYLREDVEVKCSIAVMSFVKTQLKAASKLMVERIIKKAELVDSGALLAMIKNGRLETINPADRSNRQVASPTNSPDPTQQQQPRIQTPEQQQHQQQQQQISAGRADSPSVPYQVPRPQSLSPYSSPRPASAGVTHGYATPGTPVTGSHPGYPGYPTYPAHASHMSYIGHHPSLAPAYMQAPYAQFAQYSAQTELQRYPSVHMGSPYGLPPPTSPIEMPGDFYHPQLQVPPLVPSSSTTSTPRSNHDSDILSTGKWSVPAEYLQTESRPTSISSDASGGAISTGLHSPNMDKAFCPELETHRETSEEHRAEALKRLEENGEGYTLNAATYERPTYRAK